MMNRLLLLLTVIMLLAGCAGDQGVVILTATPEQPSSDDYLNDNPELALGECVDVVFETDEWGREYIQQCAPDGYAIYEDEIGNPIRVNYTGAVYSILPNGSYGRIGFTLPVMTLTPGRYIVKVNGYMDFWGGAGDQAMIAHYTIDGVPGVVQMGAMPIVANGDYIAMFTLDAPQLGIYSVSVYLYMVHPTQTADSFLTIESITVEN